MKLQKWLVLCTLFVALFGLTALAYDTSDLTIPSSATAIVYGQSGAGRNLMAYKFGSGENVMVLGFAIHGWEDNFSQDGGALVYTAGQLMTLLDKNQELLDSYGWTIYVLPCMNPDGLIDGNSHNGPGRLTTTYLDSSGNLSSAHGVDLNRAFPTNWSRSTNQRNYNGDSPLAALEAKALAQFVQDVKGSGQNLFFDVHGWYSQIITSNGTNNAIYQTLKAAFPGNSYASCRGGSGYLTAYTTTLGYTSCLFEFPDVSSFSAFRSSGYCGKFNNSILTIAKAYGTYREKSITVTTVAEGQGTVTGGGAYRKGDTVVLTATAQDGYDFLGWYDRNGTFLGADATYQWAVTANTTVTARFGKSVTVTTLTEGQGTVTGGGTYLAGDTVTLSAQTQGKFLGWYDRNGTFLGSDATYQWVIQANTTVTARFGVSLTLTASRSGTAQGGGWYAPGDTATLTAQPQETFQGWYTTKGTLLSTAPTYDYTVSAGETLVAMFTGDRFYDVSSTSWYLPELMEAAQRGLVNGVTEISFAPSGTLNRAQVVAMLSRLAGEETDQIAPFTDVNQAQWYAPYVNWAYETKVVTGRTETTFDPLGTVTRQEFVVMVVRYLTEVRGLELPTAEAATFTDMDSASAYALEPIAQAVALKLVNGYLDGTFRPTAKMTRAEGITLLVRLAQYLDALPQEPDTPTTPTEPDETTDPTPEEPTQVTEPADPTAEPDPADPKEDAETGDPTATDPEAPVDPADAEATQESPTDPQPEEPAQDGTNLEAF